MRSAAGMGTVSPWSPDAAMAADSSLLAP